MKKSQLIKELDILQINLSQLQNELEAIDKRFEDYPQSDTTIQKVKAMEKFELFGKHLMLLSNIKNLQAKLIILQAEEIEQLNKLLTQ